MNRVRQILMMLIAVGVGGWLTWRAWGPHPEDRTVLSGYIEGENLNLSAPVSGFIARVDVARGDRVVVGQTLFAMDDASLRAQRDQAAANLSQAQAQITVAQAKLAQSHATAEAAQAQAVNAAEDLKRYRSALRVNAETVSRQQVDTAVATAANAAGQADAARGDVAAQESQITAARAQTAAQQAAVAEIDVRLAQLHPQAPAAARVQDVFYQTGEWAADNQPVVSLLPDNKVKLRFFVPEVQVAQYRPGETVHFDCDGCASGLHGTDQLRQRAAGIHAADHLQPQHARQAGVPGGGVADRCTQSDARFAGGRGPLR